MGAEPGDRNRCAPCRRGGADRPGGSARVVVEQGDEITSQYDRMIAKLIACDRSREQALARMGQALSEYRIAGVANNVEFLARLVTTPSFVAADLDMALIERRQVFFEGRAWPLALVDTLNVGGAGEAAKGGRKAPCPAR